MASIHDAALMGDCGELREALARGESPNELQARWGNAPPSAQCGALGRVCATVGGCLRLAARVARAAASRLARRCVPCGVRETLGPPRCDAPAAAPAPLLPRALAPRGSSPRRPGVARASAAAAHAPRRQCSAGKGAPLL